MTETLQRWLSLSWRVVLQAAVFAAIVVAVMILAFRVRDPNATLQELRQAAQAIQGQATTIVAQTKQVTTATNQVSQQLTEQERALSTNQAVLHEHAALTDEHVAMLSHLKPHFEALAKRLDRSLQQLDVGLERQSAMAEAGRTYLQDILAVLARIEHQRAACPGGSP